MSHFLPPTGEDEISSSGLFVHLLLALTAGSRFTGYRTLYVIALAVVENVLPNKDNVTSKLPRLSVDIISTVCDLYSLLAQCVFVYKSSECL